MVRKASGCKYMMQWSAFLGASIAEVLRYRVRVHVDSNSGIAGRFVQMKMEDIGAGMTIDKRSEVSILHSPSSSAKVVKRALEMFYRPILVP